MSQNFKRWLWLPQGEWILKGRGSNRGINWNGIATAKVMEGEGLKEDGSGGDEETETDSGMFLRESSLDLPMA